MPQRVRELRYGLIVWADVKDARGFRRTGLARRSAAVVSWLVSAYPDEIGDVIGEVPRATMAVVQRRLGRSSDA